jgi:hypothetical protein
MPAITRVFLYDDKDWPAQVEAAEVVRVTVTRQPVAGGDPVKRTTELYLSGPHAAELDSGLDPWFAKGHVPGSAPAGTSATQGGSRSRQVGPPPGTPERRQWKIRMRAWADANGLRNRKDPRFPAWQTTTGKSSYPNPLEDAFVLFEEGREKEAMAMAEQFRPEKSAA